MGRSLEVSTGIVVDSRITGREVPVRSTVPDLTQVEFYTYNFGSGGYTGLYPGNPSINLLQFCYPSVYLLRITLWLF